ncbi:MAG: hypothetical protein LBE12_02990 [Planctomycetaceae bacterium]|jgi:hypothetical protein|nr:hypothetical protein [Planctomycetaceae bacterium]
MSKDCNQNKFNTVLQFNQYATKLSSCLPESWSYYFLLLLLELLFANQYRRTVTEL